MLSCDLDEEEISIGRCRSSWKSFCPFTFIQQQSISSIVGFISWTFIHFFKESKISLDNHILVSKGRWSWCSAVYFSSGNFQHGHTWYGTTFHLYLVSFVQQKPDTYFTTQIWKRWGTHVFVYSNTVQYTRQKSFLWNIPLSHSKDFNQFLLVFFLIISPNKSVILILYILQTVGSWKIPGGIGVLFLKLSRNYDLALIPNSTFIIYSSGRSSSKNSSSLCPQPCENIMLIWLRTYWISISTSECFVFEETWRLHSDIL